MANMSRIHEVKTRTYKTDRNNFFIDIVTIPAARADKEQYEVWIYDPTKSRKDLFLTESAATISSDEQLLQFVEEHMEEAIASFYIDEEIDEVA